MRRPLVHRLWPVLAYVVIAGVLLLVQGSLFPGWLFQVMELDALGLGPSPWWHVLTLLGMGAAMVLKYTRPLSALGLGVGILVLDLSVGAALGLWLCFTDLVHYAGLRGDRRWLRGIEVAALLVTLVAVAVPLGAGRGWGEAINIGLLVAALLLVPLWWATEVRIGHPLGPLAEEREALEAERSRLQDREQQLSRQEAVAAERRRMAQDLHDGVAAHVSVAALRAAAALQGAPDAARDREALTAVRATSLSALEDLRAMVTLLRDGASFPQSWGAVQSPAQAVQQARQLGLDVRVVGVGLDGLPATVAGPVLHEALMNVFAHGDSAQPVTVSVEPTEPVGERLEVTVTSAQPDAAGEDGQGEEAQGNDTRVDATGGGRPFLATGTGLESMRARLLRHGGELRAEVQGDSWVVRFTVPATCEAAV